MFPLGGVLDGNDDTGDWLSSTEATSVAVPQFCWECQQNAPC